MGNYTREQVQAMFDLAQEEHSDESFFKRDWAAWAAANQLSEADHFFAHVISIATGVEFKPEWVKLCSKMYLPIQSSPLNKQREGYRARTAKSGLQGAKTLYANYSAKLEAEGIEVPEATPAAEAAEALAAALAEPTAEVAPEAPKPSNRRNRTTKPKAEVVAAAS